MANDRVTETSRHEATTAASCSDGISSCSLSTIEGERNYLARIENNCHENDGRLDTNDDEAFLISQFKAMEEYKKKNNKKTMKMKKEMKIHSVHLVK